MTVLRLEMKLEKQNKNKMCTRKKCTRTTNNKKNVSTPLHECFGILKLVQKSIWVCETNEWYAIKIEINPKLIVIIYRWQFESMTTVTQISTMLNWLMYLSLVYFWPKKMWLFEINKMESIRNDHSQWIDLSNKRQCVAVVICNASSDGSLPIILKQFINQ